jgi:8-oxo-dGTP diphosphatase
MPPFCSKYFILQHHIIYYFTKKILMMRIRVCCAVIIHNNKILAAKRSINMPHQGFWEFPGGKIEDGECEQSCLHREIKEELSCQINIHEQLPSFLHTYADKNIELIPFICTLPNQTPRPVEHEKISWLDASELMQTNWLPADIQLASYIDKNFARFTFK